MNIALIGYGKMGKTIEQVLKSKNKAAGKEIHSVVLKVDLDNSDTVTSHDLQEADVAIEFTTPETAYANILKCFGANIPVVVGTTGWLHKLNEAKSICMEQGKTLFYASNFSLGVNIFFEINRRLAQLMKSYPQYEIMLEEIHHKQKKDAPSGTAISLANHILEYNELKKQWVNQRSKNPEDLVILSRRRENVPGTHLVNYSSETDTIEIKHTAHSRMGFAEGAVLAAEWVQYKKGYFEMRDLLNFE